MSPPEELIIDPRTALQKLIGESSLGRAEMRALIGQLMDGRLSEVEKAALLVALAAKGETAEEITGAAEAMRERVLQVHHTVAGVVDTCGTGGDGKGTFNISTAAALVTAAAGVPVAKHGNRSVSSRSGSADILEALGIAPESTPEMAAKSLGEVGICFLFAPSYHPAMEEVMPVRRALGVRTIFNVLGPLTNPAAATRQLVGVYSRPLVEIIATVLRDLGADHALVVHGSDGLDEVTTSGVTYAAEVRNGQVDCLEIRPEQLGCPEAAPGELRGGDPAENAGLLEVVLDGKEGPLADITVLNAGAAIYVGGRAASLGEGSVVARETLRSGAARSKLEELRAFTRTVS
jgi:anthranilate phosphoribosyltransferase